MPIAILDMAVIGVLLVSGVLAMVRGFTREVLAIASWVVAGIVALMFYKQLVPVIMQNGISNVKIAMPLAFAAIFLGSLIVAYFITAKLSDVILDSRIGALDRTLGFLFGVARGFLLMVVAYGLYEKLTSGNEKAQPAWVTEAKTRPALKSTADKLASFLPDNLEEQFMSKFKDLKPGDPQPKEPPTAPQAPSR